MRIKKKWIKNEQIRRFTVRKRHILRVSPQVLVEKIFATTPLLIVIFLWSDDHLFCLQNIDVFLLQSNKPRFFKMWVHFTYTLSLCGSENRGLILITIKGRGGGIESLVHYHRSVAAPPGHIIVITKVNRTHPNFLIMPSNNYIYCLSKVQKFMNVP